MIRQKILELRKKLAPEEAARLSRLIQERFLSRCRSEGMVFQGARVALYRALSFEVDLARIEESLLASGASVCYPRVSSREEKSLEFAEVSSLSPGAWRKGLYGIDEPHSDLGAVDPASLEVIFVPGVAFGERGERIGMGSGYYDRFLSTRAEALRVSLAFDFQLFPRLEQNAWDQPVDWVLTESRETRTPRARQKLLDWKSSQ